MLPDYDDLPTGLHYPRWGWRWVLYLLLVAVGVVGLYQLPLSSWLYWTLAGLYFAVLTTLWGQCVGWYRDQ